MRLRGLGLLVLVVALAGCWPQASSNSKPSPSPSTGPKLRTTPLPIDQVPPDVAAQWQALGVTIVPPTGYLQNVDLKAEVVNHSGGKVDDATARKWAEAEARVLGWDSWAVLNLQAGLLSQLGPSDTVTQANVFGDDYTFIRRATDSSGKLTGNTGAQTRLTLVSVGPQLKSLLTATYGYPAPFPDWAFVISVRGPVVVALVGADGRRTTLAELPSSFSEDEFVAGELKSNPGTLGDVWYEHTYMSCPKNDFLASVCRS